jgi:hypothetical protein
MPDESPKPPDGLQTAGKQLWDSITATFVLNAGETEILRQAAATADEIALLEAELRASSLVVAGYMGQPRPNPLLKIIQDHRLLLRRLVDSLALPDEDQSTACVPARGMRVRLRRGAGKTMSPCLTRNSPNSEVKLPDGHPSSSAIDSGAPARAAALRPRRMASRGMVAVM